MITIPHKEGSTVGDTLDYILDNQILILADVRKLIVPLFGISNNEAIRLLKQKAVRVADTEGWVIVDDNDFFQPKTIELLKIGRRYKYFSLEPTGSGDAIMSVYDPMSIVKAKTAPTL